MKTQNGFTLLETEKEFKEWLDKQKPTRKITKLQVHHMDLPNYTTWKTTDEKVYGDNKELGRTKALDDYGKQTWKYSDGHGHYIAQHFNIFPNGKITTGRNLNSTPVGIKGWNTNAICIEIYGCFDKGKDKMTEEQKKAVIFVYALLSKKFNISINSTSIRPHCWFTASGTYLGNYSASKSAKTCPGTNFMGFGNTKKAFENNFYPLLKAYKYESKSTISTKNDETTTSTKQQYLRVLQDVNIHSTPDFDASSICGKAKKGEALTIIKKIERKGTDMYYVKAGYYITASTKYVEVFEK